jgi:lipopolysaccharide export system permease protein
MTSGAYEIAAHRAVSPSERRRIFLSPFGWYTRYMLRAFLRQASIATVGILIVALTVDLAPELGKLLTAGPDGEGIWIVARLGWYIVLRSADFIPRLLPIGCFLGVVACEISQVWSRERLAVWNSGRSPLQCMVPALILSVIAGAIQFGFDAYLRPAAVAVQIANHLGEYGERFDRRPSRDRTWMTAGNSLIYAHLDLGSPPALRDAMIYRLEPDGRLYEVIAAAEVKPGAGKNLWLAQRFSQWNIANGERLPNIDETLPVKSREVQEVVLQIDPLWLTNFGISPMFLAQRTLTKLANTDGVFAQHRYRTWLQVRYADLILPGGMVLLAVSLSFLLLPYGATLTAIVGMVLAGYAGHVSMRAFVLLGDYGYAPPAIAAWATPVAQLVAVLIILAVGHWRATRPRPASRRTATPLQNRQQLR